MRKLTEEQIAHLRSMEVEGRLTPDQVIADARREGGSPLSSLFEWDRDKAAYAHWLDTARAVIREVHVIVTTTTEVVNVVRYVSDPNRGREQGYISLFAVSSDDDKRGVIVTEIDRSIGAIQRAHAIAVALGDGGARKILDLLTEWRAAVLVEEAPALLAAAAD